MGLFALSWALMSVHRILAGEPVLSNAIYQSAGVLLFLAPIIGILARVAWKLVSEKEKGLFPFYWSTAMALFSALALARG